MRICYIGDANSIHTQRWVEWFARDHDVTVVSTTPGSGLEQYKLAALPPSDTRMRLLQSVRLLRRVLDETMPDLLHCHFINEAGWFGAATSRHPSVITAWGSDVYRAPSESALARRLNPWAVRRADMVTCDSEDQARVIRGWGVPEDRVAVIGWGVDLEEFHPGIDGSTLRRELGIPLDAQLVLSPRRWDVNSNIATIVAAHALLPEDVFLLLKRASAFEPGSTSAEEAIRASSARDRIRFLGEIPATRLASLYAAADVVVSLCTTDGTPASVLEAMAVGRPVVGFENASLAEWVRRPGGQLVNRRDPALVAEALMTYLHDPEAAERASAWNRFVIEARANRAVEFERMAEIYARLHDGHRGMRGRVRAGRPARQDRRR